MAKLDYSHNHYYSADLSAKAQQQPPKRAHGKKIWIVLSLLGLGVIGYWGWRPHVHLAPAGASPRSGLSKPAITKAQMDTQMQDIIAAHSDVDISISAIDLTSDAPYHYGVTDSFEAASVGKLITAAAYLHAVEDGSANLDDDIGGTIVQSELQQMIVESDNDAWQALSDNLGLQGLGDYASQVGLTSYDASNNTITSSDIALLLQKLYKGTLLNHTHTQLLLGYMKLANEANYISAAVPAGVRVYHKAGLLEDRVHDAAIIDNGIRPYVLVIFTNGHGTYDLDARTQILRTITTVTTKFFIS